MKCIISIKSIISIKYGDNLNPCLPQDSPPDMGAFLPCPRLFSVVESCWQEGYI